MVEPRAAVTDTHALVFHARGLTSELGRRARIFFDACERKEAILYVPAAVLWETALLAHRRRVNLRRSIRSFFDDLFSNPAYQPVDLTPEQVYIADVARPNDDPFDALICAVALSLDLPLLTRDSRIEAWGRVKTLW